MITGKIYTSTRKQFAGPTFRRSGCEVGWSSKYRRCCANASESLWRPTWLCSTRRRGACHTRASHCVLSSDPARCSEPLVLPDEEPEKFLLTSANLLQHNQDIHDNETSESNESAAVDFDSGSSDAENASSDDADDGGAKESSSDDADARGPTKHVGDDFSSFPRSQSLEHRHRHGTPAPARGSRRSIARLRRSGSSTRSRSKRRRPR